MRTTLVKVIGYRLAVLGVVAMLLLAGAVQAQAVNYKNSYHGSAMSHQHSAISIQTTTATAPTATFQSTSAYSEQWENESATPMLNADGSVNGEAYGIGQSSAPGKHIRKAGGVTPTDEDEELPIGDGLWVLLILACAYLIVRVVRRRKEALSQ